MIPGFSIGQKLVEAVQWLVRRTVQPFFSRRCAKSALSWPVMAAASFKVILVSLIPVTLIQ